MPAYVWLNDGTAILDGGTFERLDPVTAKRHPVLDMNRAVASLKSIDPGIDVNRKLPWPIAFNPAGKQAIYLFSGDIFLLDLDSSAFSRLTQTPEEEKNPQFSPNGRFISSCCQKWKGTASDVPQLDGMDEGFSAPADLSHRQSP